jgi:hypothetical protein
LKQEKEEEEEEKAEAEKRRWGRRKSYWLKILVVSSVITGTNSLLHTPMPPYHCSKAVEFTKRP